MSALSVQRFNKNLKGSLVEAFHIVADYPERFRQKNKAEKAFSIGKLSLLPASVALTPDVPTAVHVLGILDLTGVFIMQRMKLNSHFNAFAVPLGGILMTQKILLGAYGYAFMVGVVALRNTAMAAMPDTKESEGLRLKVSFGLAAVNIGALSAIGLAYDSTILLLAAGTITGALATSMINSKSHIARALRLPNDLNMMMYSYFFSGSASATISSALSAMNRFTTILEEDIPAQNKDRQPLSRAQKLKGYVSTLWDSQKREDFRFKREVRSEVSPS